MKFILLAFVAGIAAYAESEGPTKVDLGESDDQVTYREFDVANGKKFSGWTNPLGWTDDGTDDESVLPMLSAKISRRHHHHARHQKPSQEDYEAGEKMLINLQVSKGT